MMMTMTIDDGDDDVDDGDDNDDNDDAYDNDDKTAPSISTLTNNIIFNKHSALITVGNSVIV